MPREITPATLAHLLETGSTLALVDARILAPAQRGPQQAAHHQAGEWGEEEAANDQPEHAAAHRDTAVEPRRVARARDDDALVGLTDDQLPVLQREGVLLVLQALQLPQRPLRRRFVREHQHHQICHRPLHAYRCAQSDRRPALRHPD